MFHGFISPAFSSSHALTLIQQKLWYFMLLMAHKNLLTEKTHSISISRIMNFLGNTKDTKGIKRKLLKLKLNHVKSIYSFQEIKVINNAVYYSYPEELKYILAQSNILMFIHELLQYKFNSKYALFLYELCLNYTMAGQANMISLDEFREFMGINDRYSDFKLLKHFVINKAVKQINKLTPIRVKIEFIEENSINYLRFMICNKNRNQQPDIASLKELHGTYLESKAYQMYDSLPEKVRQKLDREYDLWCNQVSANSYALLLSEKIKKIFLIQKLVSSLEQDFELWSLSYT